MDNDSSKKRKIGVDSDSTDDVSLEDGVKKRMASMMEAQCPSWFDEPDRDRFKSFCEDKIEKEMQSDFKKNENDWIQKNVHQFLKFYMREMNRVMREMKTVMADKDRVMADKDRRLYKSSIARLVDLSNKSEEEAEEEISLHITRAPDASKSSNVHSQRPNVPIDKTDFALNALPSAQSRVIAEGEDPPNSQLLVAFEKSRNLEKREYYNESDVHMYMNHVLQDAITYISMLLESPESLKLMVRSECSMFSNIPDHLVLHARYNNRHTILTVEDKKDHNLVFTSEKVASQMKDYVMLDRMLHGSPSIAVLSTFNESKICWDPQCDEKMIKDQNRFSDESLLEIKTKFVPPPPPPPPAEDMQTPPASEPKQPKTNSPPELVTERTGQVGSHSGKGSVCYSNETYGPTKLLSVLCNAIILSMKIGGDKIKIDRGGLKSDQTILVLNSNETKHEWRCQENDIDLSGPWANFTDDSREYLITSLVGVGSTSRCWGAVILDTTNNKCYSCVVKYWIKIYDFEQKTYLEKNMIEEESKQASKQEVDNYNVIYKDLFFSDGHNYIGRQIINGVWCVVLPFFEPVKKEERFKALKVITHVLKTKFYVDGTSYQFKESDHRWGHVGYFRPEPASLERHLVLYDLAELEIFPDMSKDSHEKYVRKHIKELYKRGIRSDVDLSEDFFATETIGIEETPKT